MATDAAGRPMTQVLESAGINVQPWMVPVLTGLVRPGLSSLLRQFGEVGLGEQADSWVSNGANQAVEGQELEQALGSDAIERIAQQSGRSSEEVTAGLARVLPQVVDALTPNGRVP